MNNHTVNKRVFLASSLVTAPAHQTWVENKADFIPEDSRCETTGCGLLADFLVFEPSRKGSNSHSWRFQYIFAAVISGPMNIVLTGDVISTFT
jgi:hypothetical protein